MAARVIGIASVTLLACLAFNCSLQFTLLLTACLSYLPSYLDGCEYTAEGRYWDWFAKHPIWKRVYAGSKLKFSSPIDPAKQYIFCSHPHGALSSHHGMYMSNGSEPGFHEVSPGARRRDLGASIIFKLPFYREVCLWMGLVDASRAVCELCLNSGRSLMILVGGEYEQLLSQRGEHTIYIRKRKGFVKLALRFGVDIVPIYVFGETDLYQTSRFLFDFRWWLSKTLHIAIPLFCGPYALMPIAPYTDKPLVACFGKPIQFDKTTEPSQQQIDEVHEEYMQELIRVFDANKDELGYAGKELKVL